MQTVHTPITSLREKQRQEREELILRAAEEVFEEKGYYEASMDEIAARVGIAKGTIYTHFPGKEELVFAIFKRNIEQLFREIDAVVEAESLPTVKLEALLECVDTGLYQKQAKLLSTMYNGVDIKRVIAEKGGCIRGLWEGIATRVTKLLEEGKAVGEINPSIPTKAMVFSFFSLFSPKSYDQLLLGDDLSHEELVTYLRHMYFHGISNHESQQKHSSFPD